MKNIINYSSIITLLIFAKSFSQCTNIVHLDNNYRDVSFAETGYYYKDINNVLNNFEGTYLYTNGNTSFKIVMQKKIMSSMNGYYCEDMIIGGAEYIKNGNLLFNTINMLNTYYPDGNTYKLDANTIYTGDDRGCDECAPTEKWISGYITDPISNQACEIFIRRITHNGQQAIKIFMRVDVAMRYRKVGEPGPPPINLPAGEDLILIKQSLLTD